MIDRYLNKDLEKIWSDQNKIDTWKIIQFYYVQTLEEENIAPNGLSEKIKSTTVLKEEVEEREAVTNHDLASFVDVLQEKIGEDSNWIHYGLTSSDIVDTSNSLLITESIVVVENLVKELLTILETRAIQEKDTKIIGRTHGVFAEETFLGNIFGNWLLEIKRGLERLARAKENISVGKLSGPVGNYTVVSEDIEQKTLKKLGLQQEIFASQIVSRDRYAEVLSSIAILGSTFDRVATNIRSYQRSEISEMFEAFKDGQKGSSAMPHKKNPIASERISGLARILRGNIISGLENMVLWNERDISNSSVERIIFPDSFNIIAFISKELKNVIENLHINYEKINSNLELANSKLMSQKLLSFLVSQGIDRDSAYREIQKQLFDEVSFKELKDTINKKFNVDVPDIHIDSIKNFDKDSFSKKLN
jgi:adenylosuccinate lyase